MSTDARKDITHKDQCYALKATNRSQTHLLGGVNITLNYARPITIAHSHSFMIYWKEHNGGIWSIVTMDLGNKTTKDFKIDPNANRDDYPTCRPALTSP